MPRPLMRASLSIALALAAQWFPSATATLAEAAELSIAPPAVELVGPGTPIEPVWTITNAAGADRRVTLEIEDTRSWPLSRLYVGIVLPAATDVHYLVPFTIPDSAAAGDVLVRARVRLEGETAVLDSCAFTLRVREAPEAGVPIEVAPDRVRLEWRHWLRSGDEGIVEAREEGSAWHPIGGITAGSSGSAAFADLSVRPGATLEYRLRASTRQQSMVSATTRVQVPALPPLSMAGLREQPAHGDPTVAFTLPSRAEARLEVFDVGGRRVWSRDLGELAPGAHVVALGASGQLRSGVYLFRITSAGHSASARGVVAR